MQNHHRCVIICSNDHLESLINKCLSYVENDKDKSLGIDRY